MNSTITPLGGGPLSKKEDFGWAVLTALCTTLAVKLAEWAVESVKDALSERVTATRRSNRTEKDNSQYFRDLPPHGPGSKAREDYLRDRAKDEQK